MPARIEVVSDQVTEDLRAQRRRVTDLYKILKSEVAGLDAVIGDAFRDARSPMGEKWDDLADSTKEGRRKGNGKRKNLDPQPLRDTGILEKRVIVRAAKKALEFGIGADALYGLVHVFGGERKITIKEPKPRKKKTATGATSATPATEATKPKKGKKKRKPKKGKGTSTKRTKNEPGTVVRVTIPKRNFLPVNDKGEPDFSKGNAARWMERLQRRIDDYIRGT